MRIFKVLLIPLFFICNIVIAQNSKKFDFQNSSFLEDPFQVTAKLDQPDEVKVDFKVAPGFYLYKDHLQISTKPENILIIKEPLPNGILIKIFDGKNYVPEEVLNGQFSLLLKSSKPIISLELIVKLQGCDGESICYPPKEYKFYLGKPTAVKNFTGTLERVFTGEVSSNSLLSSVNLGQLFLIFLCAGFIIALTPCMYPLYPIALTAIIGTATKRRNIASLVICYIHGIALIYVSIGVIAAFSGMLLTTLIQTPWFILTISIILLVLGLSMFDLLEIKLPSTLHSYVSIKASNIVGGRYTTAFLMGVLSSLLLGPCLTPPLIIAIGFIASSGSLLIGILGLYAISLGMGIPLFILAVIGNKLLPRSGSWMNWLKHSLGLVIIIVAIYLAYPFIELGNQLVSIGVLCFIIALVFLIIRHFRSPDLELLVHKIVPIIMIIAGLSCVIYGIKTISIVNPATEAKLRSENILVTSDINALDKNISASSKPVIVIVSAKWCSICRELAVRTLNPENLSKLVNKYTIIKFDIT